MYIPVQKILNTAKITRTVDSAISRTQVAANLRKDFYALLEDTFESKQKASKSGGITIDDIKGIFKKLTPDINIEVQSGYAGGKLAPIYADETKTAVSGYKLFIPFKSTENILYKNEHKYVRQLVHEAGGHCITNVAEPKYMRHVMRGPLSKTQHTVQNNFYDTFLYSENNQSASLFKKFGLGKSVSAEEKMASIKDKVSIFFDPKSQTEQDKLYNYYTSEAFDSSSKIDVLQKWRYYLKNEAIAHQEQVAYDIECKYPFKQLIAKLENNEKVVLSEKSFIDKNKISFDSSKYNSLEEKSFALEQFLKNAQASNYQVTVENEYLFSAKIKLIEDMLSEEMAKNSHDVRAWQKK